jgi:hypothetical protein
MAWGPTAVIDPRPCSSASPIPVWARPLLATHAEWVKPQDLHRIMLWLDLNAMRLGTPTQDQAEQRAQETGEGTYAWPPEMDPENPTGVEGDRPVPGPAAPLSYDL